MVTPTRVDEDLQEYFLALQNEDHIEDKAIRRLLDAYRTKFGVELVYIGEMTADRKGMRIVHVSKEGDRGSLLHKKIPIRETDLRALAGMYDEDGLCTCQPGQEGTADGTAVLHYGLLQEGCVVGDIGMVGLHGKRSWTREERAAVRKLGRSLRPTLSMERGERVRAWERQRQDQQHRILEAIFATTDCGMVRHSRDGKRVISINQAALRLLGYDDEEQLMADGFDTVAMSVLDEDKPKLRATIQSLKKAGDGADIDYRVRHKDGTVLDIIGKIKLVEEDGELFYQRFLFDHTAQKALEVQKKLQEQSRQNEMIRALCVGYVEVYFVDLDRDMAVSCRLDGDASHGEQPVFEDEFPFTEAMERYVETHVYGPDQELLRRAVMAEQLLEALSEKAACHTNYRTIDKGQIEYVQMKAVRSGSWGSDHCIVVGFCSVDEEIRHEMDQKKLVEDSLAQAQRANAVKSTFLANMSHDIRTPMNAIIGFTTLANIHIDQKERLQEYLGKIMASGNHLLGLINDILDMSHLESGNVILEERLCSLPEILYELKNILQADIQAKQQQFSIDTTQVVDEEIYCDGLRLSQVFLNLLGNATKFTGQGGTIFMHVSERPCQAAGWADYIFRVKDTGVGMSKAFLEHIFEPFEREHSSTISGVPGTGLGMTIAKTIVDMMGGSIQVESEKGKGTEFTVSISFRLPSAAKPMPGGVGDGGGGRSERTEDGQGVQAGESRPARQKILLAEDNELNQEIAVEILTEAGYEVDVADNGQIAVDMLEKAGPGYYCIVLMDLQMPVMDGYDAARAIRKLDDLKIAAIPILAVSANAFEEDKRMAIESGMNGHFPKPIDADKFLKAVEALLGAT